MKDRKLLLLSILLPLIGCGRSTTTVESVAAPDVIAISVPPEAYRPFTNNPPIIEPVMVPWPERTMAVWGSLGRDHRGRIYVGASVDSGRDATTSLLRLDPSADQWRNLGSATKFITKPVGVSQNKIHSRVVEATNGNLYFASMDESGEKDDGSLLPTYGSQLWRLDANDQWSLIKHVPEGIIAAAVGKKFVYFLGYFGHVVYQVNVTTHEVRQTRVGATGGHVSRNFLVDDRDHVFVPRVRSGHASLVELDDQLEEVNAAPLADYDVSPNADSHGIVSFARFRDGSQGFLTDGGRLYTITKSTVTDCGLLHPKGNAYLSCLVTPDGESKLIAIGHRPTKGESEYEWIEHDLKSKVTTVKAFPIPVPAGSRSVLIYGSMTRDDRGAWYLGGAFVAPGEKGFTPALWRVK